MVLAGVTGLGVLYGVAVVALMVLQRQIIFRPAEGPPQVERVGVAGLAQVTIRTQDGLDLMAWQVAPGLGAPGLGAPGLGAPGLGAPVVLYLHGNGGNVGHRAERVRRIAALGWGALFVSYRGYGGNPGQPTETGLKLDVAAGLAALRAQGIEDRRIVVWGESLGSGLATALAAQHRFGAVVLETPYTSLADIAKRRYPLVPVDLLLRDRFDSLVHVPAIASPILILVGDRDRTVPPDMGRTILAAAGERGELWVATQGGHNNLLEFGAMEAVADFLRRRMRN